jgi:hypothetical protein
MYSHKNFEQAVLFILQDHVCSPAHFQAGCTSMHWKVVLPPLEKATTQVKLSIFICHLGEFIVMH